MCKGEHRVSPLGTVPLESQLVQMSRTDPARGRLISSGACVVVGWGTGKLLKGTGSPVLPQAPAASLAWPLK